MNNLPPIPAPPGHNSFASQAAAASLAAPVLVILLNVACSSLLQSHHDATGRSLILILGLLSFVLMSTGLILGVLALVFMKTAARGSIIGRATSGIVLSGLLLAIFVPSFVRARTTAISQNRAYSEFRAASKDFNSEAVKAVKDGRSPDMGRLIKSLDNATKTAPGGTAAILKASEANLQRLQMIKADYDTASKELTAAGVLRSQDLTKQEQLQDRKAVVQRFLAANASLKLAVESGEENYREELLKQNASKAEIDSVMNGYHKSNAPLRPLIMEIRQADDRIGTAMLGTLDLLEANWGQWHYDPASNRKIFDSTETLEKYNAYIDEIAIASKAEAAAQKQLASVMGRQVAER